MWSRGAPGLLTDSNCCVSTDQTVNKVGIEPNCQPHMQLGMVLYQLSYVANDNDLPHAHVIGKVVAPLLQY